MISSHSVTVTSVKKFAYASAISGYVNWVESTFEAEVVFVVDPRIFSIKISNSAVCR